MKLPEMMQALTKPYGKLGLRHTSVPTPRHIGPRDVLVRVDAASVCGTDLHIYSSDPSISNRVSDNQIIGHEFCGEVLEVGDQVTTLVEGDFVSSESHIVCGTCYYCLNGSSHLCQEVSLLGVDRPGGLAEYVVMPADNAVLKPDGISVNVAAIMDAFGNAVDTALCVPLASKSVLITGCGPQGLMAAAVALAGGAHKVICTETSQVRRNMANEMLELHAHPRQLNEHLVLDASRFDLIEQILHATDGLGVDILIEMSGHPAAINTGLSALKNGGDAVILGLTSGPIELDWSSLVFKGITIHFRYGRLLYRTWFEGQRLLQSQSVILESLIHKPYFALDQFQSAFDLLRSGAAGKVIFKPQGIV